MKKTIMIIGLIGMFMVLLSAETTKNELNTGVGISVNKAKEKSFTLPYLAHAFEVETGSFVFGLESEAMLEFNDEMENTFVMAFVPSAEYGFSEKLSTAIALPLEYADSELAKSVEIEFAFGTLEEDIERLSPWASFEEGFNVSAVYGQEIKENGEKGVDLNFDYSYLNQNLNLMLKPSLIFSKSLSDDDAEIESNFSLQFAKDFTSFFAFVVIVESNIDFDHSTNIEALFYPIEKFEISTFFSFSEDDHEIGFNIDYSIF